MLDEVRAFSRRPGRTRPQARRQGRHRRRQPAAALLGDVRRRRRWARSRCRSTRTRSPTRWPTCSSTPRSRSRWSKTRSRSTRSSRSSDRLHGALPHHLRRAARPARLRPHPPEIDHRRAKASAARSSRAIRLPQRRWQSSVDRTQGLRPRRHSLHLGHHRPAQGRDADLRQSHHLGAQRQSVRSARRETKKSSPICRSPGSAITCSPTRSPTSPGSASTVRKRRRPSSRIAARSAPPTRSRRRASTRTC